MDIKKRLVYVRFRLGTVGLVEEGCSVGRG